LAGGLVLALVTGLAGATVPLTHAVAEQSVECVDEVATESEAVEIAVACGHEVAVTESFTEWDTQYAAPLGRLRVEYGVKATRTRVSGRWGPIDASVVATAHGLAVAAPVNPMIFSDGSPGQPLARIERDGHELALDWPVGLDAMVEPVVDGSSVTYLDVIS
jgi:hypothetical protein